MNSEKLNQLFATAREIPVETSPDQIAEWVGVAAASTTGVLGIAAKLKLLIAKKTFIMLGISMGTVSVVVVSTLLIGSAPSTEKSTSNKQKPNAALVVNQNETDTVPDLNKLSKPDEIERNNHVPETETPVKIKEKSVPQMVPIDRILLPFNFEEGLVPFSQSFDRNCKTDQTDEKPKNLKGNGEVIKQERTVQSFSEIEICGIFDVVLTQGTTEKVIVETDANLQECVIVENKGNVLELKNSKAKIKRPTKMIVYVTLKDISKIKNTGVGDINCDNTLNSNSIELVLSNVGDVSMNLKCDVLNVDFNGVGDLELRGSAIKSKISSAAVGDLKAFDLAIETLDILHSGVGDASINVSKELTIDFRGVGDIIYKGNPSTKDITKSGVGKVKKRP